MAMPVYSFECDEVLLDSAYLDGVLTNRNADGIVTLTLPDGAAQGTRYEFHCVNPYDFVVRGEPGGIIYAGGGSGPSVALKARGAVLVVTYVNPHVWIGMVQGPAEFV